MRMIDVPLKTTISPSLTASALETFAYLVGAFALLVLLLVNT